MRALTAVPLLDTHERAEARSRIRGVKLDRDFQQLDRYYLADGLVEVVIGVHQGLGYYIVKEPELTPDELKLYNSIVEELRYRARPDQQLLTDPLSYLEKALREAIGNLEIASKVHASKHKLFYYLKRDILGLGPLEPLMNDPDIEDISVEGVGRPARVFHRRFSLYDWLHTNIVFEDEEELNNYIIRLAHMGGKHINTAHPIADVMLPGRHRATLTFSREVTPQGPSLTIRKFREKPLTICHLIKSGTISSLMATYWWLLLENKAFFMIIGPMASGKTTLLNSLAMLLKPNWKVVSIEDVAELNLAHPGWKSLVSRHTYLMGENLTEIRLFDLVKLSFRERADFIIVGEVRGEEAYALFQAAASGHGCACTFHSPNFEAMVNRLTSPPLNVGPSYIDLISNVIVIKRITKTPRQAVRRVTEVDEVISYREYQKVFTWNPTEDSFEPNDPCELVEKSVHLKRIAEATGISEEDVLNELLERKSFLEGLVKNNILDFEEVTNHLRRFYYRRSSGEKEL
ncbi:MAG: type II/IV secretion system ATPase subunit [Candidatus Verstraetearchaeota archaeon]|nr:type II/IV secretion system ATPase subunit [Candidatus Verstraetearchaeota archaeon]